MLLYNWMTTANGYLGLARFKFLQALRPSMLFDAEKRNRFERIVNFVASVYHIPMFLKVHLKPLASDGPENALFLRDFPLFFNQQDQTLVCEAIKKCFFKHATAWLNHTNVAVSVFCDNPPPPLSAVFARSNLCPNRSILTKCCKYRSYLRSFFSGKNKCALCSVHPPSSIVMRDFGGPSTITIVLANAHW